MSQIVNVMDYSSEMEEIVSPVMDQVLETVKAYDEIVFTAADVIRAIGKERRSPKDFAALLSPSAQGYLEEMAEAAQYEKQRYFGNNVQLFTPMYISNYCENHCIYCGFNCQNKINRARLSVAEVEKEMSEISRSGLREILILTGESRKHSSVEYLGEVCSLARSYFDVVGLEIYPVNTDEYKFLHQCGADYITVFQETYDGETYGRVHASGFKRSFPYRFHAQERALKGGMRGVGFGALLGLSDFRKDAFSTGCHAFFLQKKYPYAEITFSCPRLRPIANNKELNSGEVHERELLQIICAYRLFMPYASIIVSTRETAAVRNELIKITANKISAGVSTGIGTHSDVEQKGDEQFEISDGRTVNEIFEYLTHNNLQPVMKDYIYV